MSMFKKIFFKILCCYIILNNCYAPTGNYIPGVQEPHFNELPCYNNGEAQFASRDYYSPFEVVAENNNKHFNELPNDNNGMVYTPQNDIVVSNYTHNIKQYSFESLKVLNEEALSEIVTLLRNLNASIFRGYHDTVLIDQCFKKISALDKCHIQISCGVLLLYLNNFKTVKDDVISFFVVSYYNNFIKNCDQTMSDFYKKLETFINSCFLDNYGFSVENNSFINYDFKTKLEDFLVNYKNLFLEINSSNILNFSSKGLCLLCDKRLSNEKKNDVDYCTCYLNEKNGGFHYKESEKILFEYALNNEKIATVFLQDRRYKFLGYGYDVFGDIFVTVQEEGVYYFVPVGLVFSGPKIIIYDEKLFFVNNELDCFAYRSVSNLRDLKNISEEIVDLRLVYSRLKFLLNNALIFAFMIFIPIIAIMFFILFCINWSGHCYNCGNPAVKFLGGFFNMLFGMEVGLFVGEFIFNFKNLVKSDSVIRYAVSIKNKICFIRKIIRSKIAGDLIFNNFLVILGSIIGGLLAIWPLIWFIIIEASNKRLVNGVSFIAGISLLVSGFCLGSVFDYCKKYKEVKNILEYDSFTLN